MGACVYDSSVRITGEQEGEEGMCEGYEGGELCGDLAVEAGKI